MLLVYVSVLLNINRSNVLNLLDQQCYLCLCYHLQFMMMALHIITITMKRIPRATAMHRGRKNADAVKEKRVRKSRKGSGIFMFNVDVRVFSM